MAKTYDSAHTAIRTVPGQKFMIELEGNATTGYQWDLTFDDTIVRLVGTRDQPGHGVGAGGRQRFTFEAIACGESTIEAEYKRVWERSALQRVDFRVTVDDG